MTKKNGSREIRGDREGFEGLLAEGKTPDELVVAAFNAISGTMKGLMEAVSQDEVSSRYRFQVLALTQAIENALTVMETKSLAQIIEVSADDLIKAAAAVIDEMVGENAPGEGDDDGPSK